MTFSFLVQPMKLLCPKCNSEIPAASANLAEGICVCPRCNEFFRIAPLLGGETVVREVPRPATTRVELLKERDSLALMIPNGRNRSATIFFTVFALFWNAITWTAVIGSLRSHQWMPLLFMSLFVAVGLVVLAAALFSAFGEFTLVIDRQESRCIWSVLKLTYTRRLPTPKISGVEEVVAYTQNYKPVFGIALQCDGKAVKFASGLTEDERSWLIFELRKFLGLRQVS